MNTSPSPALINRLVAKESSARESFEQDQQKDYTALEMMARMIPALLKEDKIKKIMGQIKEQLTINRIGAKLDDLQDKPTISVEAGRVELCNKGTHDGCGYSSLQISAVLLGSKGFFANLRVRNLPVDSTTNSRAPCQAAILT